MSLHDAENQQLYAKRQLCYRCTRGMLDVGLQRVFGFLMVLVNSQKIVKVSIKVISVS